MCQFSYLIIGEKVQLSANPMYCRECNTQSSYNGDADYSGHSILDGMLYDCFINLDVSCLGCGKHFEQYIELCEDVSYSMELIEIKEEVK